MTFTSGYDKELFRYHRGRAVKLPTISAGERLFPKVYGGSSGLSPEKKAVGLVRNTAEAVVKVDKASSGIKGAEHLHEAANYLSRNGKIVLEDEDGELLSKFDLDNRMTEWATVMKMPNKDDKSRSADARRFIFSAPKGTDPEALKSTIRELTKEVFGKNGYSYVFGMHENNLDNPDEPDHPHIHVIVKALNSRNKRLNVRKQDLQYLRERFAVIAKKYGIELNATTRASRAQTKKAKTQEQLHSEKRGDFSHPYAQQREDELVKAMTGQEPLKENEGKKKARRTRSKVKDNIRDYAEELRAQGKNKLADALEKKADRYPDEIKTAQEEILEKAQQQVNEKIREHIRKRKSAQKQSQAQKWAINKKKQQQKAKDITEIER